MFILTNNQQLAINDKKITAFDQTTWEKKVLTLWEKDGFAHAKIQKGKKPFVIAMPPPNVTGELHIGHVTPLTFIDIFARYHRMKGEPTLVVPGTDHASIAAQNVVERELKKRGISREKLGKEKFLEEMWQYIKKYRPAIEKQIKTMGVSADWKRNRFTLDEKMGSAVKDAFCKLRKDGLIYQADQMINWCPRCGTALADDEVEYREVKGELYWMRYGPIKLATTRPETKLGDTAVAVHPEDPRYKKYIGKTINIKTVLGSAKIKVIADKIVDRKFGTGAVKVTPAHDPVDFELGKKHNLEFRKVIDKKGKMTDICGPYAGMDRFSAREKIVEKMKQLGLIDKITPYKTRLPYCYRCDTVIEPQISNQWFIKVKPLAERAKKAVKSGEIKILPKRFEKIYFNWMDNIHDWCISRQLWWGHPLPHKDSRDILDTWFSSALWPFAILGWPKKTEDYNYFYPTTLMVTGKDILFFWVARMIMFGTYFTKKVPFKTVFLHGLVLDKYGKKMSKSKNNAIDPVPMSEKYGTDALRMALITGHTIGNDVSVSEEKIRGYRNFANKIWNANNFVLRALDPDLNLASPRHSKLTERHPELVSGSYSESKAEQKYLSSLNQLIKELEKNIENYQISLASEKLYHYFWHTFCDRCIEDMKLKLKEPKSRQEQIAAQHTIYIMFTALLKLLHPFVPFVTESCWQALREKLPKAKLNKLLATEDWPKEAKL